MARAAVTCTCRYCGAKFERAKICYSRREANEWEAWAAEKIDQCPDCYRKAKEEEDAAKAAEFDLPELTAVSDKQKACAEKRRAQYVASNADYLRQVATALAQIESGEMRKIAAENGIDYDAALATFAQQQAANIAVLREANAGKLLDVLNG